MWTRALAYADATCGGKAHGLARLIAAGLRVPDGFVIEDAAFQRIAQLAGLDVDLDGVGHAFGEAATRLEQVALPPELVAEVAERARALGGPFAVRSSAALEDGAHGAAAGVFSSRTAVAEAELWPAIREVWTSALTPLVASYARRRGGAGDGARIAVIVQRSVAGEPAVLYTRPPGAPATDEMWLQRRGAVEKCPRDTRAARIEHAIDAPGGADVELVADWLVQARPIVHPRRPVRTPPPAAILAPLEDGRVWTWDVGHNPDPLSTAQAGLVERVEPTAPWAMRVCAGYLYTSPRERVAIDAPRTPAELEARVAELEAAMAAALGDGEPELEEALARYVAFYAIWAGALSPLIAAARPREVTGAERPSAVEATLLAAARGELDARAVHDRLGVLAPAWDVAVPTFAERPGLLRDAIVRARTIEAPGPRAAGADVASLAADLAERDDFWFARAQWLVRRAILARARAAGISPEDAFWIPLDELAGPVDPIAVSRRASANRRAAARATGWAMPVLVGREAGRESGPPLHGVGTGPRVTGRVVRFASLASAVVVGPGEVVVTRAVTPALAVIVVGCAAIVSETGGPLDHGAAMARELGIPCVVGCRDAWSLLSDGMIVTVDGDAGVVTS